MMAQRLVGDGLSRMNLDRTSVRARWQRPELASISPGLQFSYVPSPSGGEPPTPSRHPSITTWVAIAGWRLMPTGKMPSLGRVGGARAPGRRLCVQALHRRRLVVQNPFGPVKAGQNRGRMHPPSTRAPSRSRCTRSGTGYLAGHSASESHFNKPIDQDWCPDLGLRAGSPNGVRTRVSTLRG
jgi:hypothetical protein